VLAAVGGDDVRPAATERDHDDLAAPPADEVLRSFALVLLVG
jgi:hypothetical protein